MAKPKQCPKCKVDGEGNLMNVFDFADTFGTSDGLKKEWFCTKCNHNFDGDEANMVSWFDGMDFSKMKLSQIADVIMDDWKDMPPNAFKYVEAMMNVENLEDSFGQDSARDIASYFLANAQRWQGDAAREVKKHLRKILEETNK